MTPVRLLAIIGTLVACVFLLRLLAKPRVNVAEQPGSLTCEATEFRAEFLDVPFPKSSVKRLYGEGKLNPATKGWYGLYSRAMLHMLGANARLDLQHARELLRSAEESKLRGSKQSVSVYVAALGKRIHDPKKKLPKRKVTYDDVIVAYKAYTLTVTACSMDNKDACAAVDAACKSFLEVRKRQTKGG